MWKDDKFYLFDAGSLGFTSNQDSDIIYWGCWSESGYFWNFFRGSRKLIFEINTNWAMIPLSYIPNILSIVLYIVPPKLVNLWIILIFVCDWCYYHGDWICFLQDRKYSYIFWFGWRINCSKCYSSQNAIHKIPKNKVVQCIRWLVWKVSSVASVTPSPEPN